MTRNKFLTVKFLLILLLPNFVAAKEIEEVIVSARLGAVSSQHLTSSVNVLTAADLEKRGQVFLIDALRFIPGINITQEGGAGAVSAVRIRGAESDHTKVFIDGVEANSTDGGQFDFGHLLASQIERVEIVRGGQSLVNGAGAVGGVIYITTKKKGGANFNISTGSFGTFSIGGNLGGKNDKGFYINFGGELYRTKGHDVSTDGINEKDGYFNGTFNGKIGFDKMFGAHKIKSQFNYRYVASVLEHDGGFPFTDTADITKNNQNELGLSLEYKSALLSFLDIEAAFHGTYYKGGLNAINDNRQEDISEQSRTRGEGKIGALYKHNLLNVGLTALGGWEIEKYYRPDSNSNGAVDEFETKRFIALETSLSGFRADLTGGARYHDYRNSDKAFLWQVGAGYKPHGQRFVRFRGSYGTSIQEPSLLQLYGFFPNSFTPNPNLKPELATSAEGGLDVDLSSLLNRTLIKKLTLSATGFALNIEDEIVGFSTPINAEGTSKRRGGEAEIQLHLGKFAFIKSVELASSYTYTRAKMASGNKSLNRPKHVANLTMRTAINKFSFDWDLSWQSNQQAYNGRVGSYPLINVQVSYDVNEKLDFYVRGENLANEKTANAIGYERRGAGVYFGLRGRL